MTMIAALDEPKHCQFSNCWTFRFAQELGRYDCCGYGTRGEGLGIDNLNKSSRSSTENEPIL